MLSREEIQSLVQARLNGSKFVVVSNREPYSHEYTDQGDVMWTSPASGLVAALDPILRMTKGAWIAFGSGPADKEVTDAKGRVTVPPDNPQYTLRRIWLNKEEVDGYYYGMSNETMWPLCHIVYVRPTFQESDWQMYKRVNQKFADAILDEVGDDSAFVFVQDYHFALVPKILKKKRPDLTVAQFWHIPWPNEEAFRICPWRNEILEGLMANDLLGFHLQYHCDNFLRTLDQTLEARIDRETQAVNYKRHRCYVKPFPISVDYEEIAERAKSPEVVKAMEQIRKSLRQPYEYIAIGLDRLDYTKGIPERLMAIDRFLDKYPEFKKKFIYVNLGTLSRAHVPAYKDLADRVDALVAEINWKHKIDDWQPIEFRMERVNRDTILAYYRLANLCLVSPLHDGMNLVAKEFSAAQSADPGRGLLILSRFAGAARELTDALQVNPYDIEAFADAIYKGLKMTKKERKRRMLRSIETIKESTIYDWAASFFHELYRLGLLH